MAINIAKAVVIVKSESDIGSVKRAVVFQIVFAKGAEGWYISHSIIIIPCETGLADSDRVIIYTDGACSGNPGPGGWAAILIWNEREKSISGGERDTTNNRMELTAVIEALKTLKRQVDIELYSDSSYVVKGITEWIYGWIRRGWKRKGGEVENIDLWKELYDLSRKYKIKWKWVRGHAGNPMNEKVDKLARSEVDKLIQ